MIEQESRVRQQQFAANVLIACALVASGGCSLPWYGSAHGITQPRQNPFTEVTDAVEEAPTQTEEEALANVFDELQEVGEIDPLAREKLTNDLRSAKAEHWPLMVQQFKSALAYRRQLAESETEPVPPLPATGQPTHLAKKAPGHVEPTLASVSQPVANPLRQPSAEAAATTTAVVATDATPASAQLRPQVGKPLPPPPVQSTSSAAVAVGNNPTIQAVSYISAQPNRPWRDELQTAIAQLEQSLSSHPGSTDEVHEHMRLRMLYLLAGKETEAMLPVPGATPAQQDYWAKQLFALSSFLDNHQQPDDKQRAAGSLMHLDAARSKLAEMATLQIRNLAFVDSVDGFGVYQRREQQEFRPGDPVTLYAEVENFRSDSTKEGYRTTLATSYEVMDANGQRVDGSQFPDVEDVCQNQRSDFHMQYGVALPTRIYPGEYQLRLTITDQLSHKIGQATVPFTIVE